MAPHACTPDRPLAGKHVLVTRPVEQPAENPGVLEERLRAWGAKVSSVPMVTIRAVPFALPDEFFDWLFFTSKNGVSAFFESLPVGDPLWQTPVAVVGPATGAELTTFDRTADFISPRFDGEGAAMAFRDAVPCLGLRFLWPCGNLANRRLSEILEESGASVTPLVVYKTTLVESLSEEHQARLAQPLHMLVFTSPSAVSAYQRLAPCPDARTAIACLGPKTREEAMLAFGRVDVQADPSTLEALAEAIGRYYTESLPCP